MKLRITNDLFILLWSICILRAGLLQESALSPILHMIYIHNLQSKNNLTKSNCPMLFFELYELNEENILNVGKAYDIAIQKYISYNME